MPHVPPPSDAFSLSLNVIWWQLPLHKARANGNSACTAAALCGLVHTDFDLSHPPALSERLVRLQLALFSIADRVPMQ